MGKKHVNKMFEHNVSSIHVCLLGVVFAGELDTMDRWNPCVISVFSLYVWPFTSKETC